MSRVERAQAFWNSYRSHLAELNLLAQKYNAVQHSEHLHEMAFHLTKLEFEEYNATKIA